jgi:L-lactate dehydrogenase
LPGNASKITIVGSGAIGTTIAYSLVLRRPKLEIVLRNRDERKSWAKAFDISHCVPALEGSTIRAGSLDETAGSDIVVVTAGVLPKVDGKRSDVLRDNIEAYRGMISPLAARSENAVFIVVTNPIDSMAYAAYRLSGLPASRIIGSGTLLDGLRLRTFIGEAYELDPSKIEAEVIGEHGDTMVALWSRITYAGIPLDEYLRDKGIDFDAAARQRILNKTKRAGWDIRLAGEHSCYGISFSAVRIIEGILGYSAGPLAVSSLMSGDYGIHDVYMSLPSTLGRAGLASRSASPISLDETQALLASAAVLRSQLETVDLLLGASQ